MHLKTTLFEPDNFTDADIRYRIAPEGELERITPVLARYLPEANILKLEELDAAEINSQNFRVEVEDAGGKTKVVFLKCYASFSTKQIAFQLDFLRKLAQSGVKVNQAIATADGNLWVELGGKNYAMFHYLDAAHFVPSDESWSNAAREVGKMHRAFRELRPTYFDTIFKLSKENTSPGAYFNKISGYSLADISVIRDAQKIDAQGVDEAIFLAALDALLGAMQTVEEKKPLREAISQDIIHSDLHPHNILMSGNDVAAIIDFDSLRPSEIARDVAFFMYRFGRQFFVREGGRTDIEVIAKKSASLREHALAAYLAECPLTEKEIAAMGVLLLDEFVIKMLFVLQGVYLDGNKMWASNLPKFTMALHEIPIFFGEDEGATV